MVAARLEHRRGQDWLGPELGVPARTVSRILRRHGMPCLCELDPLTGAVIRTSKTTAVRYQRARPGELVHMDVKKIGRIPDGGGWHAHGRQMGSTAARKRTKVGFDYVHSLVDDHSRLAYSEIHDDERGATAAEFLTRAAGYFAAHGITKIERVMTDNHWTYKNTHAVAEVIAQVGARHKFIKPRRPADRGGGVGVLCDLVAVGVRKSLRGPCGATRGWRRHDRRVGRGPPRSAVTTPIGHAAWATVPFRRAAPRSSSVRSLRPTGAPIGGRPLV